MCAHVNVCACLVEGEGMHAWAGAPVRVCTWVSCVCLHAHSWVSVSMEACTHVCTYERVDMCTCVCVSTYSGTWVARASC